MYIIQNSRVEFCIFEPDVSKTHLVFSRFGSPTQPQEIHHVIIDGYNVSIFTGAYISLCLTTSQFTHPIVDMFGLFVVLAITKMHM